MKDFYKILELPKTATAEDIKKAYKRLAKIYHPDVNKTGENTEAIFAEINEAHETLGDPAKRKEYDNMMANDGKPVMEKVTVVNNDINKVLNSFDSFKF